MEYAIPKLIDYSAGKKERFWAEDAACVDCWKIILVERGAFSFELFGKRQRAEEGSAVVFPVAVPFVRQIEETLTMHYLEFNFEREEAWLKESGQYLYGAMEVPKEVVLSACALLREAKLKNAFPLAEVALQNVWAHAIIRRGPVAVNADTIVCPAVRKALEYLKLRKGERISVAELARHVGYPPLKFTRAFTKEVGEPPSVYVNRICLLRAARLLRETDLPIGRISADCGFESQFYFHNRFKRKFGVAPTVYRKTYRTQEN